MESMVNSFPGFFKGKKIFVTGHTGFKGAWLITWLHQLGAIIKGYALPPLENSIFTIVEPHVDLNNVMADIRDKARLQKEIALFQPDFIFHLAAQALVRESYRIPSETFDVNVVGTANLLESLISLDKKCTVVIITTDKVYENREHDYYYSENDMLGGYDPYSASKAAAELVVSAFRNSFFNVKEFNRHQKVITTVRAGNVIGGGDISKDRIVPDIIKALLQNETPEIRNPTAVRPWQHVLEPLYGYLLLAMLSDKETSLSGAYNFGPERNDHLTVKELVQIAIEHWGNGDWKDVSNITRPHEANFLQLDITKAQTLLGWKPKLNCRQAIEWTIDWYKEPDAGKYQKTIFQIEQYGKM